MRFKFLLLFLILIIVIYIFFNDEDNVKIVKKKKIIKKKDKKKRVKKLILYWANWCGVCKMIKPNWNEAKKILNKKYPKLKIEEINCDNFDEKKAFILENGVKEPLDGIPTILLRDGVNDLEYVKGDGLAGDRSVEDIIKFYEKNK